MAESVERLIKLFAREPTPSAYALHRATRRAKGSVPFFDTRARAPCVVCEAAVCGPRWWQVHRDGSAHMFYYDPSAYCVDCRGDWENAVVEVEVCQPLSGKSAWETRWENSTGECYNTVRKEELRAYVKEMLQG